jgi:hypothetical protein
LTQQEADMPDAEDAVSQGRQLGIWMVGLSGAALGGALAKLDWLVRFPPLAKGIFLVAFIAFLASFYYGVVYAQQMLVWKQLDDKRKEAIQSGRPQAEIDRIKDEVGEVSKKANRFHLLRFVPFLIGCLLVLVCLGMLLFTPWEIERPPVAVIPPPPPNKFLITNVPVHIHGRLDHSHTLLLNQQTGEMWELSCKNGQLIDFRSVPVKP